MLHASLPSAIPSRSQPGFTLIELSIVLVIIGLIVGGVLVGQDLIKASAVRAQISQIEKYNQAANTFRGKYGGLPGDLATAQVTQFAFPYAIPRVGTQAQGDGNGMIEGIWSGGIRTDVTNGETAWFWVDLGGNTGLIDGGFRVANIPPTSGGIGYSGEQNITKVVPLAKIGYSNYIFVYSYNNINYFSLFSMGTIDGNGGLYSGVSLPVKQAYAIDKKIDDGFAQLGVVTANYLNVMVPLFNRPVPAAGGGSTSYGADNTAATPGSSLTCFDNNNVSGAPHQYSLSQNNGNGPNCALSFKMQ